MERESEERTRAGVRNARKCGAWQSKFLEDLRTHGNVREACLAAHVTCAGAYYARRRAIARRAGKESGVNDFASQWDDAAREAVARTAASEADRSLSRQWKSGRVRRPALPQGSWHDKFIEELRRRGIVEDACRAARISKQAAYAARKKAIAQRQASASDAQDTLGILALNSSDFAARWDDALAEAIENLEGEAWRRGHDGYPEPVFYRGRQVGEVMRYSDGLLVLLLKAHRPMKYREKYQPAREPSPETRALLAKYYESIGEQRKKAEGRVVG